VPPNNYYDRGYHSRIHANLISNDEYFWSRAYASARLYFRGVLPGERIFEFGCGIGQGIAALENASGWDISVEAREECRKRGIPVYDELDEVPRKSWDVVFCRHALEHFEHPLEVLKVMKDLVAEGGDLYLVLPKERHYSCAIAPDKNQHLYCWNFRTINNLLHRAGFSPYLNECIYVLGYKALLPLKRILGANIYYYATLLVGRIMCNGELIVRARIA